MFEIQIYFLQWDIEILLFFQKEMELCKKCMSKCDIKSTTCLCCRNTHNFEKQSDTEGRLRSQTHIQIKIRKIYFQLRKIFHR